MVMFQSERQGLLLLLVSGYVPYARKQDGWSWCTMTSAVSKQADRVLYAGEGALTGSEKAMHNKPGREVLRYSESARWVD
jgi:hypothetical protein